MTESLDTIVARCKLPIRVEAFYFWPPVPSDVTIMVDVPMALWGAPQHSTLLPVFTKSPAQATRAYFDLVATLSAECADPKSAFPPSAGTAALSDSTPPVGFR